MISEKILSAVKLKLSASNKLMILISARRSIHRKSFIKIENNNLSAVKISLFVFVIINCFSSCSLSPELNETKVVATAENENKQKSISENTNYAIKKKSTDNYITPGRGTEDIQLGMSREDILQVLGKPNEAYSYDSDSIPGRCEYSDMHWLEERFEGNGIFAYLKNEKIYEISFSGKQYITKGSIKLFSSLDEVKRSYPQAQQYVLTPSAAPVNNNRDLIYVVSVEDGVAFELAYNPKDKKRNVWSIYVFSPNSDFAPGGCVGELRRFVPTSN